MHLYLFSSILLKSSRSIGVRCRLRVADLSGKRCESQRRAEYFLIDKPKRNLYCFCLSINTLCILLNYIQCWLIHVDCCCKKTCGHFLQFIEIERERERKRGSFSPFAFYSGFWIYLPIRSSAIPAHRTRKRGESASTTGCIWIRMQSGECALQEWKHFKWIFWDRQERAASDRIKMHFKLLLLGAVCVCVRVCASLVHTAVCVFGAEQLFPILKHSPCAEPDIGLMKRSIFRTRQCQQNRCVVCSYFGHRTYSKIIEIRHVSLGACLSQSQSPPFESTGLKISYKIVDSLCNAHGIVCTYCFQAKVSLILQHKDSLLLKMSRPNECHVPNNREFYPNYLFRMTISS